jgi:hypothetical protein
VQIRLFAAAALFCVALIAQFTHAAGADTGVPFATSGALAVRDLLADYYDGSGAWRTCDDAACASTASDWGADAATDTLYLRWSQTHEAQLAAIADRLVARLPRYGAPCTKASCGAWSDTPAWDAVTAVRLFEMTGDARALARARAAYRFVSASSTFASGACPSIPYQQAPTSGSRVKTLETVANEIKAGLLLYRASGNARYLQQAQALYASARSYFLDHASQLYTVHVIDDGTACTQTPHRYFASVNGLMIWNGDELAQDERDPAYGAQAAATAHAVDTLLSDGAGVFADTGGENDVVEPLIEAMMRRATDGDASARAWILRNAAAALGARAPDGSFARYFDGPPQRASSIWESNGGFAVEIAAAGLAPDALAPVAPAWQRPEDEAIGNVPATIDVDGSGIALVGNLAPSCMHHHVHVYVDGVEIADHAGIWINPSMPEHRPVLFAWRWNEPGRHTITLVSDVSGAAASLTPLVLR